MSQSLETDETSRNMSGVKSAGASLPKSEKEMHLLKMMIAED